MLLTRISRDRVFAQLRSHGLSHLGQVKRLYFEAAGSFSILPAAEPKPGLPILPEWDGQFSDELHVDTDRQVCKHCGKLRLRLDTGKVCSNCKGNKWVTAVNLR